MQYRSSSFLNKKKTSGKIGQQKVGFTKKFGNSKKNMQYSANSFLKKNKTSAKNGQQKVGFTKSLAIQKRTCSTDQRVS